MLKNLAKKVIKFGFRLIPSQLAIAICRIFPLVVGYLPENKEYIVPHLRKYKMCVNTIYGIDQSILAGNYEPDTMRIISSYVPRGGVAFDVGANVGAISIALADSVVPSGKVFAFEPGPDTFHRLIRNINLNPNLSEVISPHQCGCAAKAGNMIYHELAHARGNAILGNLDADWRAYKSQEVPIVTIDTFVINNAIARVDFMKIDVERMEYEVLLGARETLAKFHPVIFFETLPDMGVIGISGVDNFRRIESLLSDLAYRIYRVDGTNCETIATHENFLLNNLAMPYS